MMPASRTRQTNRSSLPDVSRAPQTPHNSRIKWVSKIAERFLRSKLPAHAFLDANNGQVSSWIARILKKIKASEDDLFGALFLFQRYLVASGHSQIPNAFRNFLLCLMVADKSLNDAAVLNSSWVAVLRLRREGDLEALNQLEQSFCKTLGSNLVIHDPEFSQFKQQVIIDYGQDSVSHPGDPALLVTNLDSGIDWSQFLDLPNSAQHAQSWPEPAWAPSINHHSVANSSISYGAYNAYGNTLNSHLIEEAPQQYVYRPDVNPVLYSSGSSTAPYYSHPPVNNGPQYNSFGAPWPPFHYPGH